MKPPPTEQMLLEHLVGIDTRGVELGELVDDALAVGGIGDTEPLAFGGENFDLGCAVVDHLINNSGDEEFGLGLVDAFLEEVDK